MSFTQESMPSCSVMELVVLGQAITTTAEHPFYVAGEERFVPASELTLEDSLVDSQGFPWRSTPSDPPTD
jgi:hypothetical protein